MHYLIKGISWIFYQNDTKRKELWKALKLTQLKKITLMEQYQDIFDEFQDIVETESSLITHKEENKQKDVQKWD